MKKCGYRHWASASVILAEVCMIAVFLIAGQLKSQDTILFNAVEIKVVKFNLAELGKKTEVMDSSAKAQFKLNTIADVLSNQSSVFIKSYGPGAIATSALRGGNASQTAVLWNGFNLQNNMLAQTDLSLLPSFLFENVELEYGGSSSVWGSGAIAGSIHLKSKPLFNKGFLSAINLGTGSYGKLNSSALFQISKKRLYSSTKAYLNTCENNFKYKDTSDHQNSIKYAKDAGYESKGLMQEFEFLIKNNQALSFNAWIHNSKRNLQASDPQEESKKTQMDNAVRLMAAWRFSKNQMLTNIKSAYFHEKLNYTDSSSALFSKSSTRTWMIENDNYFNYLKNQQFNLSAYLLTSDATSDSYEERKGITRVSLLAGNRFYFFHEKLSAYVSARLEYYSVNALPITGNISLEYKLTPEINVKFNSAKVYRQASLNELYWQPGGNPNLRPEQGYTFEGEINYTKKIKEFSFFISLAAYNRNIKDWILWIPGSNGNPTSTNVQDVWSRGTETSWKLVYEKSKFRIGCSLLSSYVLATVSSSQQENDESINKQLIYTPRYGLNGNFFVAYKHLDIYYYHQYFGYRFTSTDNKSWLDPYHVASLRLNYKLIAKKLSYMIFAACNNLYNQNYTVMLHRPMPLRNYELGITIQFKSNN